MRVDIPSWRDKAAAKRASTYHKIPEHWRLDPSEIERASQQRNLTGSFIEKYLSTEEILITRKDTITILEALRTRTYSSLQVVEAFCKRAAIAHQIVSIVMIFGSGSRLTL